MPIDIERYLRIRSAVAPSVSADGERIAFISAIAGQPDAWVVPATGGWPEQISFGDRVTRVAFAPRGRDLIFQADHAGTERSQLFLVTEQGERRLTEADQTIYRLGAWHPDAGAVALASNRRHPACFDVGIMELEHGAHRTVFACDGVAEALTFSADGRALLVSEVLSNLDNRLVWVDVGSGIQTPVPRLAGEGGFDPVAAGPDGSLWAVSDQGRDLAALWRLAPGAAAWELVVAADPWGIESMALGPDGSHVAYTVNEDGFNRLYLAHGSELARPVQVSTEPGVIRGLTWARTGTFLALTVGNAVTAHDVWIVSASDGAARQVTRSSTAGIRRSAMIRPQVVRYASFDGRLIPAFYYVPRQSPPPRAVLVHVHGGPEAQERPELNPVYQYLLNRGLGILAPNVRGSLGYGRGYAHLDDVERRLDSVTDLVHAVAWLVREGGADPDRIAVMGGSYGGYMTLAAVAFHPELWAAAVDVVGIANLETFLEETSPWRRKLREVEYGSLERDRPVLRAASPIHRAGSIRAPLMVIHGDNDPRVPVREAQQICDALSAAGRDVTLLRFADEGHGIVKLDNRIRTYRAVTAFVLRHLGVTSEGAGLAD